MHSPRTGQTPGELWSGERFVIRLKGHDEVSAVLTPAWRARAEGEGETRERFAGLRVLRIVPGTPANGSDKTASASPLRWGRLFQNENISRFRVFHRQNAPRVILSPVPGRQLVATGGSIPSAALAHERWISMGPRELAPFE